MMQIGMYHRDRHARQTPPLEVRRRRNSALRMLARAKTPAQRQRARQAAAKAWAEWERFNRLGRRVQATVAQPQRMAVAPGGVGQAGLLLALAIAGACLLVTVAAAVWR